MNDLWVAMGQDMRISPYDGETDAEYLCRLCFSGLGLWCLKSAQVPQGISKSAQTRLLSNLMHEFQMQAAVLSQYFVVGDDQRPQLPVLIRQLYEETGYLLTGENNRNILAEFGRSVSVGRQNLFFGVPSSIFMMNGLGVFSQAGPYCSSIRELLIRDELDAEEYFSACFNLCDFEKRGLDISEFEFFLPRKHASPSHCWGYACDVDCTVARQSEIGPYYRLMRLSTSAVLFCSEDSDTAPESLLSGDYRRLYYSLKAHYGCPSIARISAVGSGYSLLTLPGYLPNREYYFLLLTAWPKRTAFDRTQFVVRNEFLDDILKLLHKLGIESKGAI